MKRTIFLTNLIAISTALGMQNNFAEDNSGPSKNPMRPISAENSSASVKNYETLTDRDWVSKIVRMQLKGEDFNAPQNPNGQTILMCATKYANCKIMQQVLNIRDAEGNRRADINAQDINGDTALSIAAKAGDDEKILLLLKNGADVGLVSDVQTILMCATKYANCKIMQQVLNIRDAKGNRRADINAQDINGDTALSIAAKAGDSEKILLLLTNGADIKLVEEKVSEDTYKKLDLINGGIRKNCYDFILAVVEKDFNKAKSILNEFYVSVDFLSKTLMCVAEEKEEGYTEGLKLLLGHPNLDINAKDENGDTALLRASNSGNEKSVDLLLKHRGGIDVNSTNKAGQTALMFAAGHGHLEIVNLLLKDTRIDVNLQDKDGRTALMYAVSHGRSEIVDLLLKHPKIDPNKGFKLEITALMIAAYGGCEKIVDSLLKHEKTDINKGSRSGATALMFAADNGYLGIVDLLLKHPGINVNLQNKVGQTAFTSAVSRGNLEIVKLLFDRLNIDINGRDSKAVLQAVIYGREKIIKFFLKKGLNVNKIYGSDKNTILMLAAEAGNLPIVNLLLEQPGIDINAKNAEGETALDCAKRASRRSISRLILFKMGLQNQQFESFKGKAKLDQAEKSKEQFIQAVSQGDINEIDSLLEDGKANSGNIINAKDKNGNTALIIASDKGNLEVVKSLLGYGADLSLQDANGNNALIRAAKKGYLDVVEELLFRKMNINSMGHQGETALMAAAENGHIRVVKLLIKRGAKISVKNDYDKTALDIVNEKIKKLNNTNSNYESIKNILEKQNKQSNLSFGEEIQNLLNKWEVITDNNFEKDLGDWEKNDPSVCDKIRQLIDDIKLDPFRGIGRVERLTGDLEGLYSRRINKQNRFVYEIDGEKVILKSCKGHYEKEKRNRTRTNSGK